MTMATKMPQVAEEREPGASRAVRTTNTIGSNHGMSADRFRPEQATQRNVGNFF